MFYKENFSGKISKFTVFSSKRFKKTASKREVLLSARNVVFDKWFYPPCFAVGDGMLLNGHLWM